MTVAWHLDVRPSMQPVVYPTSGELVTNDFTSGDDGGPPSDDLVVVDIAGSSMPAPPRWPWPPGPSKPTTGRTLVAIFWDYPRKVLREP